jgi:OOP family OmpA-OmpF porin
MKLKITVALFAGLLLTSGLSAQTETKVALPTGKSGTKWKELPSPDKLGWKKNRKLGDKLMQVGSVTNAAKYYTEALAKKPAKFELNQKIADAFFALRDYEKANNYYNALVAADSVKHKNLTAIYQSGLTAKYLGKYEEAKTMFAKFNKLASSNDDLSTMRSSASRESQGCDLGLQYINSKEVPTFRVNTLNGINQPLTDFAPMFKDANTVYFGAWTSDSVMLVGRSEKYAVNSKLYEAKRNGNNWASQELAGEINQTKFHVGNPALTKDGKTMYYTQCAQDETARMICNIFKSTAQADGWSAGEKLKLNKDGFTTTHPNLGKNEAGEPVLYFSSDRNAGRGMDIFSAPVLADGTLGSAKTVASINTRGDEMTPFYEEKTKTLYFSSNGHINIGGTDIFSTVLKNGEWAEPQNLGTPVNSSVDDMYFHWDESAMQGFVVSNRPGGQGLKSATCCDDIYQVQLMKINLAIKGVMKNGADNKAIENGLITLYDAVNGKEIKTVYATDGVFLFDLETDKEYRLMGRKNGFEDLLLTYSTMDKRMSDTAQFDLSMVALPQTGPKVGDLIGTVNWDFNYDRLTNTAPDVLNKVIEFMTANPNIVVQVGSHTDSKGTEEYNMKLSQRRSDAVMKYLLSKKMPKNRLVSKAFGEGEPIAASNDNPDGTDNPDGRAVNRRTEFKVLEIVVPVAEPAAK